MMRTFTWLAPALGRTAVIIGIGAHDNGTFTQNGSCTSASTIYKGMYTGIPNHLWGQKGAVSIR